MSTHHRRMRDPAFRQSQWEGRFSPHVAVLNRFVDELAKAGRGRVPYVAPIYGGLEAGLLCLMRDPARAAAEGSGFLCLENDDATAERFAGLLERAGIRPNQVVTWNAYPWYINRRPNANELNAGIEALHQFLRLLPQLIVVVLMGLDTQRSWDTYAARYPREADPKEADRFQVLRTFHASPEAFIGPPKVRARRQAQQESIFAAAARLLNVAIL